MVLLEFNGVVKIVNIVVLNERTNLSIWIIISIPAWRTIRIEKEVLQGEWRADRSANERKSDR